MRKLMSASEIAHARLPEMPTTRQKCSEWISRLHQRDPTMTAPRPGRGGGLLVDVRALPPAARKALANGGRQIVAATHPPPLRAMDQPPVMWFRNARLRAFKGTPEHRRLRFRLLLAEFIVRFADRKRVAVSVVAGEIAEAWAMTNARPAAKEAIPVADWIASDFYVAPTWEEFQDQHTRAGKFLSDISRTAFNRLIAQETARAFIAEHDLLKMLSGGYWKRDLAGKPRCPGALRSLFLQYVKELRVPSIDAALRRFEFDFNRNGPVDAPALVTLAREGYLRGLPLTLSGMKTCIRRGRPIDCVLIDNLFWGSGFHSVTHERHIVIQIKAF